ncbi:MAG: hypothetical protein QOJ54_3503 [Aliidongia sp.]|jgi:hypothetical protein|nr:hypothetical protein [Aliidongia sp.]
MAEDRSLINCVPEAVGAIVETVAILYGYEKAGPLGGFAVGAVAKYVMGRIDAGKEILISCLQQAGMSLADFHDAEQFTAGAVRYVRAARDQAADDNLRLLAGAMVGLARRQQLWASDFIRFANAIAPLTPDELLIIGTLMTADSDWGSLPEATRPISPWAIACNRLIPAQFPSYEHAQSAGAMAQRSGLILPLNTYGVTIYGLGPSGRQLRAILEAGAIPGVSA